MKIIHIAETVKGGVGTCMNVFDIAFRDIDIQNTYLVPQQHSEHLSVTGKMYTFDRPKRGFRALANMIHAAKKAARLDAPDIFYFQSTYSLAAMVALRFMGVQGVYVYNPHGWAQLRYSDRPIKRKLISSIEGRLSGMADIVINVSENDRVQAKKLHYRGSHVIIENAMPDIERPTAATKDKNLADKINLLFVGRFDRQKGLDLLIPAFVSAAKRNPNIHLHVIGAAVESDLNTDVEGVSDRITFHGWLSPSEITSHYDTADLVLLPSRWESLPMVIIESLRAGTPVMLSDRCGMSSLIDEGVSGFTVPLTEESWVEALSTIEEHLLRSMRPAARALYERRYGLDRYRTEMVSLMEQLAGEISLKSDDRPEIPPQNAGGS